MGNNSFLSYACGAMNRSEFSGSGLGRRLDDAELDRPLLNMFKEVTLCFTPAVAVVVPKLVGDGVVKALMLDSKRHKTKLDAKK
mmetsp:Transcript_16705/g.24486  ORF Transcript_16705/g.24486 Transcript_16705/m.24486 type:complete len:84 (+) Transcript_16705:405-656(+)